MSFGGHVQILYRLEKNKITDFFDLKVGNSQRFKGQHDKKWWKIIKETVLLPYTRFSTNYKLANALLSSIL